MHCVDDRPQGLLGETHCRLRPADRGLRGGRINVRHVRERCLDRARLDDFQKRAIVGRHVDDVFGDVIPGLSNIRNRRSRRRRDFTFDDRHENTRTKKKGPFGRERRCRARSSHRADHETPTPVVLESYRWNGRSVSEFNMRERGTPLRMKCRNAASTGKLTLQNLEFGN